jgi:hypothetical protein
VAAKQRLELVTTSQITTAAHLVAQQVKLLRRQPIAVRIPITPSSMVVGIWQQPEFPCLWKSIKSMVNLSFLLMLVKHRLVLLG